MKNTKQVVSGEATNEVEGYEKGRPVNFAGDNPPAVTAKTEAAAPASADDSRSSGTEN